MNDNTYELRQVMPGISPSELKHITSFPLGFYAGLDEAEIDRLIIFRRAVRAGYYNDDARNACKCRLCTQLVAKSRELWR